MGFFDNIDDDNLAKAAAKTTQSSSSSTPILGEVYDDGYDEEAVGSGFSEAGEYDIPDDAFGADDIYMGDEEIDILDDYEQILDEELPSNESLEIETTATFEETEEAPAPVNVVPEVIANNNEVPVAKPVIAEPVVEVSPVIEAPVETMAPEVAIVNTQVESPQPVVDPAPVIKPKKKSASVATPLPTPAPGRLSQITATVVGGGAVINGDVSSSGPISVEGIVKGNVSGSQVAVFKDGQIGGSLTSEGKIDVKGYVGGGVTGSEISISDCRIVGPVSGSEITIFEGAVVIGDIAGDNLVVSGAIKGDIDIKEKVLLSPTAIVKGNITSAKIIIEDGAAIEGTVTQTYAKVSPSAFFNND